ncbi:hypothetical protein ACFX11_029233 [Malus domestica]
MQSTEATDFGLVDECMSCGIEGGGCDGDEYYLCAKLGKFLTQMILVAANDTVFYFVLRAACQVPYSLLILDVKGTGKACNILQNKDPKPGSVREIVKRANDNSLKRGRRQQLS